MELIKNSRPMTKEEFADQKKSWVVGELMIEHPKMSKEKAEQLYQRGSEPYWPGPGTTVKWHPAHSTEEIQLELPFNELDSTP